MGDVYVVPHMSKLDFSSNEVTISGQDRSGKDTSRSYMLKDAFQLAAVAEVLTNQGKTEEVNLILIGGTTPLLGASLDQEANQGLTDPQKVKSVTRFFNLADGTARIILANEWGAGRESGQIEIDFDQASLAGYLSLMSYLKRFIKQGVKVISPSFPDSRKVASANPLKLEVVVDGKTFGFQVLKGGAVTISCLPVP